MSLRSEGRGPEKYRKRLKRYAFKYDIYSKIAIVWDVFKTLWYDCAKEHGIKWPSFGIFCVLP